MELDRVRTLLEKFRVTAPHDKMRTMAEVVEELARIACDLDRRLEVIEGRGESASATPQAPQVPRQSPENEFAFEDKSPYDDPDAFEPTNIKTL